MAHHRNSQSQSIDYIYGKCHTIDGAINIAWQQWEERETAVENAKADQLAAEARLSKAERTIGLLDRKIRILKEKLATAKKAAEGTLIDNEAELIDLELALMEAEVAQVESGAELIRAQAFAEQSLRCYNKAVEEREFIRKLKNDLLADSECQFRELWLSDPDTASEMAQDIEWALEWCSRIDNRLATQGTIGYDHLESMKAQRHYHSVILPYLRSRRDMLTQTGGLPLSDAFLAPLNIRHRLEKIAPGMVKARDLTEVERLTLESAGAQRSTLLLAQPQVEPNPEDLLPALARPDKVLALPMNMTPEDVKRFQLEQRPSLQQLLLAATTRPDTPTLDEITEGEQP